MTDGGFRERFVVCGEDLLSLRMVEALLRQARRGATDVVVLTAPGGTQLERLREMRGVEVVEIAEPDDAAFLAAGVETATAVAFVHREDVVNIHRALRCHELAPGVRQVLRLHATALAGRIRILLPTATVLSVSATAAPAFVAAAVGVSSEQAVELPANPMVVADRSEVRPELVVAGLARRPDAGPPVLLPADDDRADLVLARVAMHREGRRVGTRRAAIRQRWRRIRRRLRAGMTRSLARATLGLVALLALGTIGFAALAGLSWGDAIYLTVLDSAGAADPDTHASTVARVIQAVITVLGIAIIPLVTAVVVDAAVSARFADSAQRLRSRRGHVVVVGLGTVGVSVVEQLHERGVRVVAVDDTDGPGVAAVRRMGLPVIVGDTTRGQTLTEASVGGCRALVAVGSDDIANLETGLVGRSLRGRLRVVLRLRDDDLAQRVERSLEVAVSRSVSFLAAPAFAAAMRDRKVVATVPVGRTVLLVADVPVGRASLLTGLPPGVAAIPGEVRVIGVFRGSGPDAVLECPPRPQRRLKVGDRLVVAATRSGLADLHQRAEARTA